MWGHYWVLQQNQGVFEQKLRSPLHHYVTTSNTTSTHTPTHTPTHTHTYGNEHMDMNCHYYLYMLRDP